MLVTKEAGKAGGFQEKIAAAQACNLKIAVLQRPQQEDGYTLAAIERLLLSMISNQDHAANTDRMERT